MTREELFEGYVADTLDDEGSAELEALLADDPDFAIQFAQDLLETGLFEMVDSTVVRKEEPGAEDEESAEEGDGSGSGEEDESKEKGAKLLVTETAKPAPLKLVTGVTEDELPPSLQRLLPGGVNSPAPLPAAHTAPPREPPAAASPPPESPPGGTGTSRDEVGESAGAAGEGSQETVTESEEENESPGEPAPAGEERVPPVAEPPVAEPPVAQPPIAEPPVAQPPAPEPLVAHPLASTLPPPAPPPPAAPRPRPGPAQMGPAPAMFGHHEQPHLSSARQRSPVGWFVIAAVLLIGIGVALFVGLTRDPPAPPEEAGIVAKIDAVNGVATLTRGIKTEKLTAGMDLFEGDLINVKVGSARIAFVNEKTYVHLRTASEILLEDQSAGKHVRLALGELTVEAAPQAVGRPMVIQSTDAKVSLLGTRATIRAIKKETLVEVSEGNVRVERRSDGEAVELGAGSWTLVGSEQPLQAWGFVAAVNLNGPETTIDGNAWQSFAGAKAKGLQVEAVGKPAEAHTSTVQPSGYVPHAELRSVLMTSMVARGAKLSVKWPLPNGRYQVFVWIMEDAGNQVRSLRLNVEEKLVGEDLGKNQNNGEWDRYGPYPADIKDGALDLLVSADHKLANRDPHLAGLAVYSTSATSAPAPPTGQPAPAPAPATPPGPGGPGTPPGIQPTVP